MAMLYEDKVELMFGGEVGREMIDCGALGNSALRNVVELPSTQSQAAVTNETQTPDELSA